MMTIDEATTLVEETLNNEPDSTGCEVAVMKDRTREYDFGWVFFYNSKKFVETGDERELLAGNAPLIVEKSTGTVHVTGTADPVEFYIENFKRYGSPYAPT